MTFGHRGVSARSRAKRPLGEVPGRIRQWATIPWVLWIFWVALASCDSGSSIADPDPPPARVVQFRKLLEREVPPFPSGVAVTPDGRWLVSLGFSEGSVSLYDATTLELVTGPVHSIPCSAPLFCQFDRDSIFLVQPHAAVVSPNGSMAVVTSRNGALGFSLPSLEVVFASPGISQPRYGIRDRAGRNYYFNGEEDDVFRVTISDGSQALFEAEFTEGIALSRDERDLLALTDQGARLKVLGTPDLELRRSIDLPLSGVVVVPLKHADKAIVLGGSAPAGQTSARAPLMALPSTWQRAPSDPFRSCVARIWKVCVSFLATAISGPK